MCTCMIQVCFVFAQLKFLAVGDVIVGLISFDKSWQYLNARKFQADECKHMINRCDDRYKAADRFILGSTWGWRVKLVMRFADKARDIIDIFMFGVWLH